ncbi:MAG: hypothetical protein NTX03_07845 [Bacteroidetes bacterium]|nr:hypothetical protein [Bacteroidota bacterium]
MKLVTTLLLAFISQICFGQDTLYFDADWQPAQRTVAEFFRINKKEGKKWARMDYFSKTKQLEMKGIYASATTDVEDGYFEWYYPDGKLLHTGNYENENRVGEHLSYTENGSLEAKENYKTGSLMV